MTDEELKQYIEMWKQTVAVQQHFNDIEWRIRGLALTALTFTLGAAALAAREPAKIPIFGGHAGLPGVIMVAGLILWLAFWFVDDIWYHRLLIGAVKHGEVLESELRKQLPAAGLTAAISKSSRIDFTILKSSRFSVLRNQHAFRSTQKLRFFYSAIAVLLFLLALGLWGGTAASKGSGVGSPTGMTSTTQPSTSSTEAPNPWVSSTARPATAAPPTPRFPLTPR